MKNRFLLLFFSLFGIFSFSVAQNYTFNSSYQLGRYGEYYGVTVSNWIKTWNNEKVILRGTAGLFTGNHWGDRSNITDFRRIELGMESRNTMVTGKDFFNIINASYFTSFYKQPNIGSVEKNGWMFSFGFGTKIISPASVMARYVWGIERGIRLGIEFDF